jgi:hypothetical protein
MKKLALVIACVSAVALSGCASILNEQTQPVNVSSSNGKAIEGSIDGTAFKGPGIVNVTRQNKDKVLMTSTEGCAKETAMPKSVDSKFFINIISGGGFGSTTDYSTEKMWRYSESVVVACK